MGENEEKQLEEDGGTGDPELYQAIMAGEILLTAGPIVGDAATTAAKASRASKLVNVATRLGKIAKIMVGKQNILDALVLVNDWVIPWHNTTSGNRGLRYYDATGERIDWHTASEIHIPAGKSVYAFRPNFGPGSPYYDPQCTFETMDKGIPCKNPFIDMTHSKMEPQYHNYLMWTPCFKDEDDPDGNRNNQMRKWCEERNGTLVDHTHGELQFEPNWKDCGDWKFARECYIPKLAAAPHLIDDSVVGIQQGPGDTNPHPNSNTSSDQPGWWTDEEVDPKTNKPYNFIRYAADDENPNLQQETWTGSYTLTEEDERDIVVSGEATVKRPYKDGRVCKNSTIEAAKASGDTDFVDYCAAPGEGGQTQQGNHNMEVVFSGNNCYAECQKIGQSRHSQCQQLNQEFVKAMNSAGCKRTRCDLEDSRVTCD